MSKDDVAIRESVEITLDEQTLELLSTGDVAKLTPAQKSQLYLGMCESIGLNPAFRPFGIINTQQGQKFYAFKSATEQLRKLYGLNIISTESETLPGDIYMVTVTMEDKNGRRDSDVGAVSIKGLAGEALANAYMKAHTKAKRRCTLAISGLGILDETEIESIPNAEVVDITNIQKPATYRREDPEPEVLPEALPEEATPAPVEEKPIKTRAKREPIKTKAMQALHGAATEVGYDHDDLRKYAQGFYNIESLTELTQPQLETLTQALDPANLDWTTETWEASQGGVDAIQNYLEEKLPPSSHVKMLKHKLSWLTKEAPQAPEELQPEVIEAEYHEVEAVDIDTLEQPATKNPEPAPERTPVAANEPIKNWTQLWSLLRQQLKITNKDQLEEYIGMPIAGQTPEQLGRIVMTRSMGS